MIVRDLAGYLANVSIECTTDIIKITEDERLVDIKAHGNDVSCVLGGERACLLGF